VGRRNWDAKRKRRVQKRRRKIRVRGGPDEGGHSHSMTRILSYNNLLLIVMIQQLPCPLFLFESYFQVCFSGSLKMTFFSLTFFPQIDHQFFRVFF